MKKTVLTIGLLTLGLMATDFSSMTTEELIALRGTVAVEEQADFRAEMQSRISNMTAEERAAFTASRQAMGGKGAGNGATPPSFSDIDADGDGQITQEELDTARSERQAENAADGKLLKNADNAPTLADIDTNGDGVIDETEFQSNQSAQMEQHAEKMGGEAMKQQLQNNTAINNMGMGMGQGKGGPGMMGHNR